MTIEELKKLIDILNIKISKYTDLKARLTYEGVEDLLAFINEESTNNLIYFDTVNKDFITGDTVKKRYIGKMKVDFFLSRGMSSRQFIKVF